MPRCGAPLCCSTTATCSPTDCSSVWRVAIRDTARARGWRRLAAAIGVRVVVTKRRRLFLWRDVRIHLDDVEQLGRFIELEAVAPSDSDLTHEYQLIAELRDALTITDERLVAVGYAEQLRAKGGQ